MTLLPNTRLGRYEIRSQIGSGGMGDVYLASDSLLGRQVAIKVFQPHFAAEAERLTRFMREAKSASALNHPGILTVFDVGRQAGMYFMVTELVEGLTLRDWVNEARPSLAELSDAIRQAALALARQISDKRLLLVLDNFEHLLEGATLVSELLAASHGLKVLATSRAPQAHG